jgi:hypothetical protein
MSLLSELLNLQVKKLAEETTPDGRVDVDLDLDDPQEREGTIFVSGVKTYEEAMDVINEPEINDFIDELLAPYDLSMGDIEEVGHDILDDGVSIAIALPSGEEIEDETDDEFLDNLHDDDED